MTRPTRQYDLASEAEGLLPSQFASSTNLHAAVRDLVEGESVQKLEDVLWQLIGDRWISSAVGEQLEQLRLIVGSPEQYASSSDLQRAAILRQIAYNTSHGEAERIIELVESVLVPDFVQYECRVPKAAYFYVENPHNPRLADRIQPSVEAGTIVVIVGYAGSGLPFGFGYDRDASGSACGEELSVDGWGETTLSVGGGYPELLT